MVVTFTGLHDAAATMADPIAPIAPTEPSLREASAEVKSSRILHVSVSTKLPASFRTYYDRSVVSQENRPLADIEFQVSQVIERLEAGAGAGERSDEILRKQSAGFLIPDESSLETIVQNIEGLICKSDTGEDGVWPLPPLNHVSRVSVLAHSIAAYAGSLERTQLQKLNARINSDTTRWLSHLFRWSSITIVHRALSIASIIPLLLCC